MLNYLYKTEVPEVVLEKLTTCLLFLHISVKLYTYKVFF